MAETDYAVAPGEFLQEWIDDGEFTVHKLAQQLHWSDEKVSRFLEGKLAVDDKIADDLERVTSVPSRVWQKYEALFNSDLDRLNLTLDSRPQP